MHDSRPHSKKPPAPERKRALPRDRAALGPVPETILQMDASLESIRNRIDEAYNHICLDLPEINMEIYRTFQHASDTLDSLSAHVSTGTIAGVVEGIGITLRNVMIRTRRLRRHDARTLQTVMLTCGALPGSHPGLGDGVERFISVRDDLRSTLETIIEHEEGLIETISSCLKKDLKSFEKTLSSVVAILKDLIFRSTSVKDPILKIMSGLQTHDIVNQDISTVSLGLRKMHSLMSAGAEADAQVDSLLFREKASFLSRGLVSQLIEVIRRHCRDLKDEIGRIESMVSRIKEDKDALNDFLLTSDDGKSTFDIATAEVLQMFADIITRIEDLSACKERQQALTRELTELSGGLDRQAMAHGPSSLTLDMLSAVEKMISRLRSDARMLKNDNGHKELRENLRALHKGSDLARHKLEEMKVLLMGSIRGIDTYSGRCTDAIGKFKQDIHELMTTLDGSDRLLKDLESITLYASRTRGSGPHMASQEPGRLLPEDLSDIIHRLENPHSSSLASKNDSDVDEGLTLF